MKALIIMANILTGAANLNVFFRTDNALSLLVSSINFSLAFLLLYIE
jgi:hypothetical protein